MDTNQKIPLELRDILFNIGENYFIINNFSRFLLRTSILVSLELVTVNIFLYLMI